MSTDPPPQSPSPRTSLQYRPGEVVAEKYRLLEQVGEGGMGTVWLARHRLLEIDVAVKLIELDRNADQDLIARRVLQEARTAARLSHAAVARVFDYGKSDKGDPFVVSEFLRGETLEGRIERAGPLDPIEAVRTLLPIVDALAAAHTEDIVHRDVKSANIFLARDNAGRIQPKLLDFGIASFVSEKVKITHAGSLLGTPAYMPPEQARGSVVDFRADVWSTCVVLYEMLTGMLPFTGANYNAVLFSIINDRPQPLAVHGVADSDLQRLIDRGLAKDREQRWAAMREIGEALALWLFERGVRVDICGAALRTTWLESGLSGVRLELGDSVPPGELGVARDEPTMPSSLRSVASAVAVPATSLRDLPTERPSALEVKAAAPPPRGRTSGNEARYRSTASLHPDGLFTSRSSRWLAVAAGALIGGFVVTLLLSAGPRPTPLPPGPSVAAATAAPAPSPSARPAPPPEPAAPASAASAGSSLDEPASKRGTPVAPGAVAPRPTAPSPPPRATGSKPKMDFGF